MSKPYLKHTLKEGDHKVMRQGPPPHVGWWFTTAGRGNATHWRYWDGKAWSTPIDQYAVNHKHTDLLAKHRANLQSAWPNHHIAWCYHWPQKARVGRVNPETREVTGAGPDPYKE